MINAPPGASLHWNVLGNDFVAPGDTVTVDPLSKTNATVPAGVTLDGSYVYLKVPSAPSDPPVQFTYGDTDGGTPSLAQVIVHAVPGAKLPPIANDDVAPPPRGGARHRDGQRAQERRRPARVGQRPEDQLGACRGRRARPEPDDQARSAAP